MGQYDIERFIIEYRYGRNKKIIHMLFFNKKIESLKLQKENYYVHHPKII